MLISKSTKKKINKSQIFAYIKQILRKATKFFNVIICIFVVRVTKLYQFLKKN